MHAYPFMGEGHVAYLYEQEVPRLYTFTYAIPLADVRMVSLHKEKRSVWVKLAGETDGVDLFGTNAEWFLKELWTYHQEQRVKGRHVDARA